VQGSALSGAKNQEVDNLEGSAPSEKEEEPPRIPLTEAGNVGAPAPLFEKKNEKKKC
jgi:hypothetical protein